MNPVIVWFRQDLRLADNPALQAALASGRPVVPLYIRDSTGPWSAGAAQRCWLDLSLRALGVDLAARGGRLILRHGPSGQVLPDIVRACNADAVYWNRRYEPAAAAVDAALAAALARYARMRA